MAITTTITDVAKKALWDRLKDGGSAESFKVLLLKVGATGTYGAATTNVGTPGSGAPSTSNVGTDEVAATGGYTSGGMALAGAATALTAGVGSLDFSDAVWPGATISAIGAVIYRVSDGMVMGTYDFGGGTVSSTAGDFTLQIPASGTGVLRTA